MPWRELKPMDLKVMFIAASLLLWLLIFLPP
jgi:hypothetical protein